jgi:leucyl-tRNA synthetase
MKYDFKEIESFWQKYWKEHQTFKTEENFKKSKYYILDMFPYPSGSGLHVGHILGYVSSDIYARYKRLEGFNVLHPMGFDSFGLPAEQYAIQTGKHPEKTTEINICQYKKQLSLLGFSFDWSRELKTSDPSYYRWTQWIFIKLFNSWYDQKMEKARQINELISIFEKEGNIYIKASETSKILFTNKEWAKFTSKSKEKILLNYRLAYKAKSIVNWCPDLGTVLANDEVKNGKSERGGYPVYQREMRQWSIRITAYAERLLKGLDNLLWPDSLKESQRNWIGKYYGVRINFPTIDGDNIEIFTTRPETIFGVSFIVLAPEHRFIEKITNNNEKIISGVFTGSHALHPFTGDKLPIYVSDYVLGKYGTSAIMAVPAHDKRDYQFAKKFGLKVLKESGEGEKIGKSSINYRLRDSVFSRQRYWGEPIPIFYGEVLKSIPEENLPLQLPDKLITSGNPPLSSAKTWAWDEYKKKISNNESIDYKRTFPLETSTMPGWAGSSWYFLRFMNTNNEKEFVVKKDERYWKNVDLYVGGAEHATGHLLYARFLQKFLKDHGIVSAEEPFRKIINQGMILSRSAFVIRLKGTNKFISEGLIGHNKNIQKLAVDIRLLKDNNILDIEKFKNWRKEFATSDLILENGKFFCPRQMEKMSKSRYNVINPDTICEIYGADTLRMYEVFLGPIEQTKNWNLQGINGVHQFIKKFCKLFHHNGASKEPPSKEEYRVLHKTIKKVREDIENFSFNTSVSAFMIAVNFLSARRCCKRSVLEPLVILLSPFAPHIAEEIWKKLGHEKSISFAKLPKYDVKYLSEETIEYPILFNGKLRFKILLTASTSEIKEKVLNNPKTKRYLNGKILKRIFIIQKKIINIVTY